MKSQQKLLTQRRLSAIVSLLQRTQQLLPLAVLAVNAEGQLERLRLVPSVGAQLPGKRQIPGGSVGPSQQSSSSPPIPQVVGANRLIERELSQHLQLIEESFTADALLYSGEIRQGADDYIRDAVEEIDNKTQKLVVILETSGGFIEVVERIVATLRHHYAEVEFIIPSYAMSAGTVLVMSGDAIHMDYYSVLGPIDPQLERGDSRTLVPALGYLAQYERLIEKSRLGQLTTAELNYLIERFDPGELYSYEQARELSIELLKQWLVRYKFKNWHHTRTRNRRVTPAMRRARAAAIAKMLNDTDRWHSHGRGISMEVLTRDLNLLINDFGVNQETNRRIKDYYRLLTDYMAKLGSTGALHIRGRFTSLLMVY